MDRPAPDLRRIRPATTEDSAVLASMLFDFNTEYDTETDSVAVLTDRFARILTDDAVFAVIAERSRQPVGFGLLTLRPAIWYDGPVAQLEELYVLPTLRDRGLGTALLDLARRLAAERGAPEMHINVDEVDTATRRFYERHGFATVEPGVDYRMLCYIGRTHHRPD